MDPDLNNTAPDLYLDPDLDIDPDLYLNPDLCRYVISADS